MNNQLCALCLQNPDLRDSHIIPAFVYRWIKSTSATGYLRKSGNPNLRVQDGDKPKLLCNNCEGLLNTYETQFAKDIFYPYVNTELSEDGVATNTIQYFEYESWLLKFAISVQWRILITRKIPQGTLPDNLLKLVESFKSIWRDYLCNTRRDTGECETHLILFQNLATGLGDLPEDINDQINFYLFNFYLLRSIDSTITTGQNQLGVFSKFGPMCIFISILPKTLKDLPNSRIRLKGQMSTIQKIANPQLTQFLFIDRPNEALPKLKYSDNQKEITHKSFLSNPSKVEQSLTIRALKSDLMLRRKRDKNL